MTLLADVHLGKTMMESKAIVHHYQTFRNYIYLLSRVELIFFFVIRIHIFLFISY